MFAKLKDLASATLGNVDIMSLLAIAAVGWGLNELGKIQADRQENVMALTGQVGQLSETLAARYAELTNVEARLVAARAEAAATPDYWMDADRLSGDGKED